jgi:isoquinoline 1-oxidoreductase
VLNVNSGANGIRSPYAIANQRIRYQPADSPLPQDSYRALAATANAFARESAIDELALALGRDPLDVRLASAPDARLADVLRAVANAAGWHDHAPDAAAGVAWGIAAGLEKEARARPVPRSRSPARARSASAGSSPPSTAARSSTPRTSRARSRERP